MSRVAIYRVPHRKMSKLKVPLKTILKTCTGTKKMTHRRYFLYVFSFINALRQQKLPVEPDIEAEKLSRYWGVHRTIPEIILEADKLLEEERLLEVYEMLNKLKFSNEVDILWRIARVLYKLCHNEDVSPDVKWEMTEEAYTVLEMALTKGECADVHKWMAIIIDSRSAFINIEYRVANFIAVRDHLIRACELNPNDFCAHYMLGKWCYDMSHMTWFQRCLAKLYTSCEVPKSSYIYAYRYLSRAEELHPRTFIPNLFHLGNTCFKIGQYYKAKYYLTLTISLSPKDEREKHYITKAKRKVKLLETYHMDDPALLYDERLLQLQTD